MRRGLDVFSHNCLENKNRKQIYTISVIGRSEYQFEQ